MLTKRLTPGLAAYLVLVIAGLFLPIAAVSGYLAIAMYYILPFRRGYPSFHRRQRQPDR